MLNAPRCRRLSYGETRRLFTAGALVLDVGERGGGQEASTIKSKVIVTIAVIAVTVSILTLAAGPASAWTHRRHVGSLRSSALNFYSSRGTQPLLQRLRVRRLPVPPQNCTSDFSRLWWNRYSACTG